LKLLWMFWLLPIIGAAIGGAIYRFVLEKAE
jgi:aquaporin Z